MSLKYLVQSDNKTVSNKILSKFAIGTLCVGLAFSSFHANASDELPGDGVTVTPIGFGNQNTQFQDGIIKKGLEKLGYKVKRTLEADPTIAHVSVGQGDADYMPVHWDPLHNDYYERAGGDDVNTRFGALVGNAAQGLLIDKKTADAYGITSVTQLKDPEIAALFDMDGDGKADLTGCNPGWGCETLIEQHLDNLDLRDTVTHRQGVYVALMADTIARFRQGKPVLYFTWTPMWVNSLLVPGKESTWLTIPDEDGKEIPGKTLGFTVNTVRIMANNEFLDDNPAAKRFFELATIDINDVNKENSLIQDGEKSDKAINKHVDDWIAENTEIFEEWLSEARAAAKK
ncbi:glycine betaine/L-proline ABC transporter substrate-binding protein ProX [Marinomonas sp. 5E14-1]|uniref:glycine betaine/L-proline ABC transporter substrate-binding protein ProX n=1 Tax=Marinomonas sp. 5E14-1 TaxID=3153922 RepID=UPI0032640766